MKTTFRQASLPGFELGDYVKESIDFLRSHEPPEGYFVGFSGGKDSITTLELCRMAGVRHFPYFSCTTIDPPEIYRFIKTYYPEVTWLYPRESFWRLLKSKVPPMRMVRWCCTELKHKPSRAIPLKNRIMGIRREESHRRASRPRIDKVEGQTLFKPIFSWPEWAVWEFIESRKLPYPALYNEGWARIGCIVCPFILGDSPSQIANRQRSMARWPQIWRVFEKVVKEWAAMTITSGLRKNQIYKTPEQFWGRYINGKK